MTRVKKDRIRDLNREIRNPRQANETLTKASVCFAAASFDRPFKRLQAVSTITEGPLVSGRTTGVWAGAAMSRQSGRGIFRPVAMPLATAPKDARTPWRMGSSASKRVADALALRPAQSAEPWSKAVTTMA